MPLKHAMAFWIIPLPQTLCPQCDLNLSEKEAAPFPEKVAPDP